MSTVYAMQRFASVLPSVLPAARPHGQSSGTELIAVSGAMCWAKGLGLQLQAAKQVQCGCRLDNPTWGQLLPNTNRHHVASGCHHRLVHSVAAQPQC